MSKFTDLCKSWTELRRSELGHQENCLQIAVTVIRGLTKSFEMDREYLKFLGATGPGADQPTDFVAGAMYQDEENDWCFNLQLTLFEAPNQSPKMPIRLPFRIVKPSPTSTDFTVHCGASVSCTVSRIDDAAFQSFFDDLYDDLKVFLAKPGEIVRTGSASTVYN